MNSIHMKLFFKPLKFLELKNEEISFQTSSYEKFFIEIVEIAEFISRFLKEIFIPPFEFKETLKQCYQVGYRSLALVGTTGFIMGLVLTIQSRPTLIKFGAASWLPMMVAVSIIKEIGPVVTALISAGKTGSSIGAEIGSMRVTEQIDAMEVSASSPFKYLVVTRVLATTFMIPILVVFADAIALFGSYVGINLYEDISLQLFYSKAFNSLDLIDVFPATIKTFVFGFTIGIVGCYKGYNAEKGTQGVGQAANSSVVMASLLVFIIDMLAVQITNLFFN